MRHAQNNNRNDNQGGREKNSQAGSQEQQAQPQKLQHSADETGGWRLGPYGHLRSGGEPDEISERKKKRRRTTMIIGIASLVFAVALIVVVLVVASPTSSFFQQEQRAQQGQTTAETGGETGASDVQLNDSNTSSSDKANEAGAGSSSSQDAEEHVADGASATTEAGNAAEDVESSTEGASSGADITSSNGTNEVRTNQLPDSSFLYDTDIAELAKADSFNDGQRVQIEGEVVGEPINDETDGAYRWIVVQDSAAENPSTIEVRVSTDLIGAIDSFGAYGQKGSTVQVRGTYQLACADHQGLSDIHADEVQVLAQGETIKEPVNSVVLTSSLIAIVLGVLLLVLYQVKREQTR